MLPVDLSPAHGLRQGQQLGNFPAPSIELRIDRQVLEYRGGCARVKDRPGEKRDQAVMGRQFIASFECGPHGLEERMGHFTVVPSHHEREPVRLRQAPVAGIA